MKITATETREYDEPSVPVIKRKRSSGSNTSSIIDFLQKKNESENKFKESNMELERKRLEVEERGQTLNQERLMLEKKERKAMMELFKELVNKINK